MSEGTTLEQALHRLEEITRALEGGAIELDASLALYEEGIHLLRAAEQVIRTAELRIEQLHENGALSPVHRQGQGG